MFFLCFPQNARAANFYWGGRILASPTELDDFKLELKGATGYRPQSVKMDKDGDMTPLGASIFSGLDFNRAGKVPLRLEYEISLQNCEQSIRIKDSFRTAGPLLSVTPESKLDLDAVFSQSLSLWFDIPVGWFPLKPYLGGGVGLNLMFYDSDMTINRGSNAIEASGSRSGRELGYFYSLGGGARLALNKRIFLDLNLRWVKKQDWSIDMYPLGLKFSSRILDAGIGLQYYF